MAFNSFLPILRARISILPLAESSCHFPSLRITGTGNGHSCSPTVKVTLSGVKGSSSIWSFS